MPKPRCASPGSITDAEYARLDALGDGGFGVEREFPCELQAGHPDLHCGVGQDVGPADAWWVCWGPNVGADRLRRLPYCPAEDGADLCLLPLDHWGDHSFHLRSLPPLASAER
jgi:hypothetical protein